MQDDKAVSQTTDPHPDYGPCDRILPDGGCAECQARRVGYRGPLKSEPTARNGERAESTLSEAAELCREIGIDPNKRSPSLDDIKALMLHVARRSGAWRNAGLALVDQLNRSLDNNAEKYCALCFALGLVSAQEARIGAGLRFAAPLVADELLRSD